MSMKIAQPARFVGRTKLVDVAEEMDCWLCPDCNQLFHAIKKIRGKTTSCVCCKERVVLDPFAFVKQTTIDWNKKELIEND